MIILIQFSPHIVSYEIDMSLDLNDAAMSGNAEEVLIRLNMGEDPNQKFYPRYRQISIKTSPGGLRDAILHLLT